VPEKSGDLPPTQLRFLQAGFHRKNTPAVFWGTKVFLMILLPAAFLAVRLVAVKLMSTNMTMAICIVMALIGFYSPDVWLRVKTANRRDRIFRGLPDALDLLVVCVEAGLGLDGAISRVAEEIRWSCQELSDELKLLNLELRAGKLRQEALRNLARRIDLEDMRNLVTLLIQTDKFGTSVCNALRVYSDSLRTKRYQRAEEVAVKLPTKLIFPLILFIFPALFVAILGPAAINLYRIFLSP
jgi:tight adherence protein C